MQNQSNDIHRDTVLNPSQCLLCALKWTSVTALYHTKYRKCLWFFLCLWLRRPRSPKPQRILIVDKVAWALYILIWNVLWMESEMVFVSFFFTKQKKRLFEPTMWKWCSFGFLLMQNFVLKSFCVFAHLRKSGARTIMCWKSSSDRRPSLSRSASSMTFSHTILTSSSVSSFRVSLFRVFSRSDLHMKSSSLKSYQKTMK